MFQADYIKDMHNTYLVIRGQKEAVSGYRVKMILNNSIEGVLKTELRCIDEENLFYYNITSLKTVFSVYEHGAMNYAQTNDMLKQVLTIIEHSSEYLLSPDDFIVDPKYMYMDGNVLKIYLCHLVGHGERLLLQLNQFLEYLMNKVDYKDERAVLLVYALYKATREEECTFQRLWQEINKKYQEKPKPEAEAFLQRESKERNQGFMGITPEREEVGQSPGTILSYNGSGQDRKGKQDNSWKQKNRAKQATKEKKNDKIRQSDKTKQNNRTRQNDRIRQNDKTRQSDGTRQNDRMKQNGGVRENDNKNGKIREGIKWKQNTQWKEVSRNKQNRRQIKNGIEEQNNRQKQNNSFSQIFDEIDKEEEIRYFSLKTYFLAGMALLTGLAFAGGAFKLKLLYNTFGTHLDPIKALSCLILIILAEIFVFVKLFDKDNQITKIVTSTEYLETTLPQDGGDDPEADMEEPEDSNIIQEVNWMKETDRTREAGRIRETDGTKEADRIREIDRTREAKRRKEADREREADRIKEADWTREVDGTKEADKTKETDRAKEADRIQEVSWWEDADWREEINGIKEYRGQGEAVKITDSKKEENLSEEETVLLWRRDAEEEEQTVILSIRETGSRYYLEKEQMDGNEKDTPMKNLGIIKDLKTEIKEFPFLIGKKEKGVHLTIKNPSISRIHAKLTKEDEEIHLWDLNSTNGTYLNGTQLEKNRPYLLKTEDKIVFSDLSYIWKEIRT